MPTIKTDRLEPYVPKRVHIAPVGFEVDRVVQPILRMRGEVVYLIANVEDDDQAQVFRDRVTEQLHAKRIDFEIQRAPIFDLYETAGLMARLIRKHARDRVYINVSSGSKIQALAGVLSTMLVSGEGLRVTPYYAEAERYAPPEGKPISTGCTNIRELPRLQLQAPSYETKVAISILASGSKSKTELAIELAKRKVLDPAKLNPGGEPKDEASRVSLQTAADLRIVRRLQEWGFVEVTRRGKKSMVALTEEGSSAAKLYGSTGDPAFPSIALV